MGKSLHPHREPVMNLRQFYRDREHAKRLFTSYGVKRAASYLNEQGYSYEVARVILFAKPMKEMVSSSASAA